MKNFIIFLTVIALIGSFAIAELPTFVKAQKKQRGDDQNPQVIYAGEGFSLVVDMQKMQRMSAKSLNREDLFAARFAHSDEILPQLENYGKVLFVGDDKKEAIISITNPKKADELAALLHEEGGVIGCGSIIKLMKPQEVLENSRRSAFKNVAVDALIAKAMTADANPKIIEMIGLIESDNIRDYIMKLSAYQNRYHRSSTGKAASDFIFQTYSSFKQSNPNLTVRQFRHSATPQPSVIAVIPGTSLPNEKVIIGSHIDSISSGGSSSTAPGADDNASGTATVKEILRIITTHGYRFKRTVEFHGYAAEEAGLVGSGEVAASYKSKGENVAGMIQIDMNIYSTSKTNPTLWLVTNDTNTTHTSLASRLLAQYTSSSQSKGPLFAGSSDHRSWHRRGYPAIFPFENPSNYNRNIHTSRDTYMNSGNLLLADRKSVV